MTMFSLRPPQAVALRLSRGFTLIEAMVVVALLGILAAIAGPSFSQLIQGYQVNAARDNLINTIQLARSEAIRTGQTVVIRNRTDCALNNWGCGWFFFRDLNANDTQQTADPRENTVKRVEVQRGATIRKNNGANVLRINAFGQSTGATTFNIAPSANSTGNPACTAVVVSFALRVRTVKGSTRC